MTESLETETYSIGEDGNELLTERDCIKESQKGNLENQLVVLSYSSLKLEYRLLRNQIWYVSHGPGCKPDSKFSDTVHLYHPIDRDRMAVSRREILGVVRPEVLKALQQLYPEFQLADRGDFEAEGPGL